MIGISLAITPGNPILRNGFVPASVTGLVGWWDFADAATVTLNSGDVASISDKSGNSRAASQGTAGNQPGYSTAAINSKNVANFVGANNDSLTLANSLNLFRARTGVSLLGVARIATLGSAQRIFTVLANPTGTLVGLGLDTSNRLVLSSRRVSADGTSTLTSTATIAANTAFYFACTVDYATGSVALVIDDTSRTQTASWTAGATSEDLDHSAAPTIGRNSANILTGDLAELSVYSRAISASEIGSLRTRYFKPKYNLA